jgi:hypothetical protein
MHVHLQLGRHVIENPRLVLPDTVLLATAAIADPFRRGDIKLMPVVRQLGEIQFPTTTATVGSDLLSRRLSRGLPRCGGRRRLQIEQVPLAPSFDGPLTPPPVDPPLQAVELVQRGLVRCFQLFIGGRCGVEHMLQLGRLLESLPTRDAGTRRDRWGVEGRRP